MSTRSSERFHELSSDEDAGDALEIFGLKEDPSLYERTVRSEMDRARTDPEAHALLQSLYYEEDRDAAFRRFLASSEFEAIQRLLSLFGVGPQAAIVEVGGGSGCLAWALGQIGFKHVDLIEPNGLFITGTGYLETRTDSTVKIWNDLDQWYRMGGRYDLVLTHNCVHHFRGIAPVAAAIRQRMRSSGRWLMLREWFAETPAATYRAMRNHPYSQRYGLYEFPYAASEYIAALERVGLKLQAVVPATYCNGALETCSDVHGSILNGMASRGVDVLLKYRPNWTTAFFEMERAFITISKKSVHRFTRPGAMLFRRLEVTL